MLVDTRLMLAFGGGHITGALNIGATPMLSIWAGWLLDPDEPILLVLDSDSKVDEVVKLFIRTGYTKFAGYLVGGMKAWDNAGFPLEEVGQMTVHEIKERRLGLANRRCARARRMGERPRPRRGTHLPAGTARESRAARQDQAGRRLLRQRLSREHRHQHPEAGRIPVRLQRAREAGRRGRKRSSRSKAETTPNESGCSPSLLLALADRRTRRGLRRECHATTMAARGRPTSSARASACSRG